MERYSEYKDSGVQWLGEIPSHWEMQRWRFLLAENKQKNSGCKEKIQLQFRYGEIVEKADQGDEKDVLETISNYTVVEKNDIIINGLNSALYSLLNGLLAFITMFLLKKLGDFLFKKESMGGGDIKLLFIFGMVLTYPIAILSIFVGSLIGLPIALLILYKKKDHVLPFGPFLAAGATLLLLLQVNLDMILNLYR